MSQPWGRDDRPGTVSRPPRPRPADTFRRGDLDTSKSTPVTRGPYGRRSGKTAFCICQEALHRLGDGPTCSAGLPAVGCVLPGPAGEFLDVDVKARAISATTESRSTDRTPRSTCESHDSERPTRPASAAWLSPRRRR